MVTTIQDAEIKGLADRETAPEQTNGTLAMNAVRFRIPVTTQIAIAQIINQHEDEVRSLCFGSVQRGQRCQ